MAIPLTKYGESFAKYVRGVKKSYLAPFEAEVRAARKEMSEELMKSALGNRLWRGGAKPASTPKLLLDPVKLRSTSDGMEGGFKILGLAALMIKGGKTAPFRIRPRRGKFLRFDGRSGEVFAQAVQHPGSRVERVNAVEPVLEKRAAAYTPKAARALDEHARESFR